MRIALKASNGQFVCAEGGGGQAVVANRSAVGPWETFELVELDTPTPAPRPSGFPLWAGCSDFRLFQRFLAGENITPIIDQRKAVGANLLRVFAMKFNNTGWDLIPQRQGYFQDLRRFFDALAPTGLRIELTALADTALVPSMDWPSFWTGICAVALGYPFVVLELCNEWNHPTQRLRPQDFPQPIGVLASHGSGMTDADPVAPRWDFATYHARRDGAKGFTNYSPYEFQSVYPQPCPLIPDEGAKPQDYGGDPTYAYLMGSHAALGWGGTFHSDSGIDSRLFTDSELVCATRFFQGVQR